MAIRAGWTVVLVLWGTTIVALLLAGWRTLRPCGDARRLHAAAGIAFIGCVVLLVATLLLSATLASAPPAPVLSTVGPYDGASTLVSEASQPPVAPVQRAWPVPPNRIAGGLGVIWIIGVVVLLLRLGSGWMIARGMRLRAPRVEDLSVQDTLATVRRELGVSRTVSLLHSTEVDAPVVVGARYPALLIPSSLMARMPREAFAALLAHECAHVARHDYAVNLAQRVADAVLFFSPAVQWVSHCLREAREFCCDDTAVQFCGADPDRYVRVLTTLASLGGRAHGRAVLASTGPRLITRVRRLVLQDTMLRPSLFRGVVGLLALVLVGAFTPPVMRLSAAHLSSLPLPLHLIDHTPQDEIASGDPTRETSREFTLDVALSQRGAPVALRGYTANAGTFLYEAATVENLSSKPIASVSLAVLVVDPSAPQSRHMMRTPPLPVNLGPAERREVSNRVPLCWWS